MLLAVLGLELAEQRSAVLELHAARAAGVRTVLSVDAVDDDFIAGLGVSGPQIVEGWYGEPWGRPYYRMKDYVAIMRKIFARG